MQLIAARRLDGPPAWVMLSVLVTALLCPGTASGEVPPDSPVLVVVPYPDGYQPPPTLRQGGTHTLYLHFVGRDITTGNCSDAATGCSFLCECDGGCTIAPHNAQGDDIEMILSLVRMFYAPFNVLVTTQRPVVGDYLETVVGGQPSDLCLSITGAAGIAPGDCGNLTEGDLSFAFSDVFDADPFATATTIAHEAAHAWGLGHTDNERDLMFPSLVQETDGFVDADMISPDDTACQGDTQNSFQELRGTLGAAGEDTEPPTLFITDPADGATNLPNELVVIVDAQDNQALSSVTLFFNQGQADETSGRDLTAPYRFAATLPNGTHTLTAVAIDEAGLSAEHSIRIGVGAPTDGGTGGGAGDALVDGAPCTRAFECDSGLCDQVGSDDGRYCTRFCPGGTECAEGMTCETREVGALCVLSGGSGDDEGGCAIGGGPHRASRAQRSSRAPSPLSIAPLFLTLWLRRRRAHRSP